MLTLPDEGRAAWQRVAGVLAVRGYTFRYSDADLLTLNTDYVDLKSTLPISIFVQVTGHQLLLRGRWVAGNTLPSNSTAIRHGGVLGGTSAEWPELEAIARELGGTAAYYRSQAE